MNTLKINGAKINLELPRDNFGALSNALNEVCNGIKILEFETTIGISREEARTMLEFFSSTYRQAIQDEKLGNPENVILGLTSHDLSILINTIAVVCVEIDAWEFKIRLGMSIEEGKKYNKFY